MAENYATPSLTTEEITLIACIVKHLSEELKMRSDTIYAI